MGIPQRSKPELVWGFCPLLLMKVTENVKRLLLHFTFCTVQNIRCILLFVLSVSLPCFFSPQGFSPHQIAKMSVFKMSVHATSQCLSNSCARRIKNVSATLP